MRSPGNANGPPRRTDWQAVNWRKAARIVKNLRQRIFRAARANDLREVRSLQKLMLRCYSNILMSVRRVTQTNAGKYTPGVDQLVVKTPAARGKLVDRLAACQPWRVRPVRRVYIPKRSDSSKLRPLGIPTVVDRRLQGVVKNALEPEWECRFEGSSYGFRPKRAVQDAIEKVFRLARARSKPRSPGRDVRDATTRTEGTREPAHDHLPFLRRLLRPAPALRLVRGRGAPGRRHLAGQRQQRRESDRRPRPVAGGSVVEGV
jgi:RNA-directed DNA polymerase